MGKQTQDDYSCRHDVPPTAHPVQYKPKGDNDPLDFSKKHPLYDIQLDKKGPEFSEIDDKRAEYIEKFAGKVDDVEIEIPRGIPGLVEKTGPLPSNRRLWRPTFTLERSGWFNMRTNHYNSRFIVPFVFGFYIVGNIMFPMTANYHRLEEDNNEFVGNFYDKLNHRQLPLAKNWLRPG